LATVNQLGRGIREKKKRRLNRSRGLNGCPQKRGVVIKAREMKPKKPNSAKRKIAKVKLSTGRIVLTYISGLDHSLREFSQVLVRGGHVKDLPGIQYHLIKGKFDFHWGEEIIRMHSFTKYGIPTKPLNNGLEKPFWHGKQILSCERIRDMFVHGPIYRNMDAYSLRQFRPLWMKIPWAMTPPEFANTQLLKYYGRYYKA